MATNSNIGAKHSIHGLYASMEVVKSQTIPSDLSGSHNITPADDIYPNSRLVKTLPLNQQSDNYMPE